MSKRKTAKAVTGHASPDPGTSKLAAYNKSMVVYVEGLTKGYDKPILANAQDADRLARHLSERYSRFKFTVAYLAGRNVISATPVWANREGYTDLNEETLANWYPPHEVLVAYASGYDQCLAKLIETERRLDGGGRIQPVYPSPGVFYQQPYGPWGR